MAAWMGNGSRSNPAVMWRQRPALRTAAKCAGYFALGLATGAGQLFSGSGPFGAAMTAAAGSGLMGLCCLIGVMTGYTLSTGVYYALRYITTSLMVFTVGFMAKSQPWREHRVFMPAVASAVTALTGVLYDGLTVVVSGIPVYMRLFLEVVLAGGCAYLFGFVSRPEKQNSSAAEMRRAVSVAVLCACALMGLGGLELFGVLSIGRFGAVLAVMAAGFCGGPMAGCAAGTAIGLGMDLAQWGSLFYAAAWSLAGLFAGALYRYGRLTFAAAFCAANAVAVLLAWDGGAHIPALYECFAASVMLMLLPQAALTPVGALLRVGRGYGEISFRRYQADRLDKLAEGFRRLYETAAEGEEMPEKRRIRSEAAAAFDRTADAVCKTCAEKERCWKKEYADTVRELGSMAEGLARRGTAAVSDLPVPFRQKCISPEAFVSVLNGEMRGLMYRRQYTARLREGRAAAYGQFLDMAEVMADCARQLSGVAGPDAAAERRLIRFCKNRDMEASCSAFRDGRGRLHAAIEGAGVENIGEESDYLERLSAAVGVRLCRISPGEKGRMILRQAEPLAVSVGIANMKKEGESVSGDRGTYFKTDGGILCVILSDGMGTGEAAAGESTRAVAILEALLRAGMEPASAMRLLNSAAMLRNGDAWGYATVDLCCIDLFTGETCFYKYGAAPSYVKNGRNIRRVRGASLAAGMLAGMDASPDIVRLKLRPGNVALIASDGVLAENDDRWLREILAGSDGEEVKSVARRTLRAACARFGSADDMTALAIRVEARQ